MKRKRKKQFCFPFWPIFGVVVFFILVTVIYLVQSNIFTQKCANSLSCEESLTFKVENGAQGVFNNQPVVVPQIALAEEKMVLGTEDEVVSPDPLVEKHIYINLKTQTLSAYDGNKLFMETPVSTGLWGKTPTGDFTIWIKLRSTRMSGGSGADYYNLPNVPYVMYFSNAEVAASRGFSLHGAYWHNNFGHPMSHGCINMKETDVAKLYDWATPVSTGTTTHSSTANPGTTITIYDDESEISLPQ